MPAVDFSVIAEGHAAINARLENWARWLRSSSALRGKIHPMFRQYKSPMHWQRGPDRALVDPLDAQAVEKAVSALPEGHRYALRWSYVWPWVSPSRASRALAVTRDGLADLLHEGRQMLINRRI